MILGFFLYIINWLINLIAKIFPIWNPIPPDVFPTLKNLIITAGTNLNFILPINTVMTIISLLLYFILFIYLPYLVIRFVMAHIPGLGATPKS